MTGTFSTPRTAPRPKPQQLEHIPHHPGLTGHPFQ